RKGYTVGKGDPGVELETDNVNVEVNSDYSGVNTEILAEVDEDVSVGDVIAKVDERGEAGASRDDTARKEEAPAAKDEKKEAQAEKPAEKEESTDSSADSANDDVVASPAARKLAREKNIDLSKVKAQDPLDRIRTEDVERASQAPAPSKSAGSGKKDSATEQDFTKQARRENMSRR